MNEITKISQAKGFAESKATPFTPYRNNQPQYYPIYGGVGRDSARDSIRTCRTSYVDNPFRSYDGIASFPQSNDIRELRIRTCDRPDKPRRRIKRRIKRIGAQMKQLIINRQRLLPLYVMTFVILEIICLSINSRPF